ncbi:MAG: hypothetical protein M1376_17135 [Planctomycetes bacterium]|nr:hypothetical protein [Planctomycetota bacterium]
MRTRLLLALWLGLLGVSGVATAGPLPEPTPGIAEDKSIAYRAGAPLIIDGDLSDWEGAAFKLIGRKSDVFRGEWSGPDDLTCTWSVMWDDTTFYFAAAIRDDVLAEAADPSQPWTGDCTFLYLDADGDGTIENKACFFLFQGQPTFLGMTANLVEAANAGSVSLAIVMEPRLGKAGRIVEVAIPLDCLPLQKPIQGAIFRMVPGFEEGTQSAEQPPKFLDWGGTNPDDAANLRQVIFAGATGTNPWAMARDPNPADGAAAVLMPLLRWTAGEGALLHDVYVGTSPALGPADLAAAHLPVTMYYHARGIEAGATYYWRVDEIATDGKTVCTGNVWSFTAQALTAYRPDPADAAGATSPSATLTWLPGAGALKHHVCFGENLEAVKQGAAEVDKGTPTEARFVPGTLEGLTTYYWRVDEIGAADAIKAGPVWSFTTYLPIDDFESYTDELGSAIFDAWMDGLTNGLSGSVVGYPTAPFAEQKIVHGGKQSMPLDYNNIASPFYSEAQREFASAQDWTMGDASTLVLFVRGRVGNGAAALSITVKDASNHAATVIHPDATVVGTAKWNEWKIPLSGLAGVNLTKVKMIVIGVGDKANPKTGGAGRIYIDDIYVTK